MSVLGGNPLLIAGDDGYQISRSVRLRSSASAYFNRTASTPTSGTTWTWSGWIKRGALGSNLALFGGGSNSTTTYDGLIYSASTDTLNLFTANGVNLNLVTTQVFRDPSAWYHVVAQYDSTQATAANRAKLYINGVQVTAFGTSTYPAQNTISAGINANGIIQVLGSVRTTAPALYFDGYLTEVNFIDGQALTPASFGETDAVTGVWKPKKYAGTYGTNGFYLNFSDNSAATAAAIGKDWSGNGNNWTPNNISVTAGVTYDSMLDVPTLWADGGNGRGNYAVLNPLDSFASGVSNGNLTFANGAGLAYKGISTFVIEDIAASQKYYVEYVSDVGYLTGIVTTANSGAASNTSYSDIRGYYSNGNKYSGTTATAYGGSFTASDQLAMLVGNGQIEFFKNNVSQGVAFTGLTGAWKVCTVAFGSAGSGVSYNFGQRPFAYTPPTGFKALNTQNLPDATIKKGNQYFDVVTRTGTGSSDGVSQVISSLAFTPDLVWNKARSNAFNHNLVDSARGNDAILFSNLTNAETSLGTTGTQLQLTTNGFTAIQRVSHQATNQNGVTYADWCWKESVSAGFDIVTCATNGSGIITSTSHALGVTPSMIILKARTGTDAWYVYHKNSTATATQGTLQLNTTTAVNTVNGSSGGIDKWTVSSSAFAAGNAAWTYQASTNHIAFLFAEVAGYSKFGSYTGNGSADGPFVYLGFRPRWVMIKATSTTGNWEMLDSSRDTYNPDGNLLRAQSSGAEIAASPVNDFLSNGFKPRSINGSQNDSGVTYIYAAFAENPFKNSLAR